MGAGAWVDGERDMKTNLEVIGAALQRDSLIVVEFYCQNSACAVRQVEVRFKDHDGTLMDHIRARWPRCVVCRKELKVHWALTFAEDSDVMDREARYRVNQQIYERDHPGRPGMPASVLCDDSLPGHRGGSDA